MHGFNVACVGNAKVDLFLHFDDANKHLRLNEESNELCFHLGEKIAVDKCRVALGGNAANVAVGLSRLGLKTGLVAEIGDDELSDKVVNSLKKENVHTENIKRSKGLATSVSVILSFKADRTIFSQHIKREHDFNLDNLSTRWVYLTSIGEEWRSAYKKIVNFVINTKCPLAFNPGTLQLNSGYESIKDVLNVTNVLFVNKEEAIRISKIKNQKSKIEDILIQLQNLGPKIVVITDGENGSYALDEKQEISHCGIMKVTVAEKTGAGDAYSAGFLAAILNGLPIKDAMRWGTASSASTIEKVGAQNGLLRREEMEEKLKHF